MDEHFAEDFSNKIAELQNDEYVGVVLRSEKSTFFSGGDQCSRSNGTAK
jgi:enoyl-CoA hydratase/carnithine racemase